MLKPHYVGIFFSPFMMAACVGDAALATGDPVADAGPDAPAPPVAQPGELSLSVEVTPLEVVRGADARVKATVRVANPRGAVTAQLQNLPAYLQASTTPTTVAGDSVEIPLTALPTAAFGDVVAELLVSTEGLRPRVTPVPIFVRGKPGELDTSFGNNGVAQPVPNLQPGAMLVGSDGLVYLAGTNESRRGVFARYTDRGILDANFGNAGVVEFLPPGATETIRRERLRGNFVERDGSINTTLFFFGGSGALVRTSVPLNSSLPLFAPPSWPTTRDESCFGTPIHADGDFTIVADMPSGLPLTLYRCALSSQVSSLDWGGGRLQLDAGLAGATGGSIQQAVLSRDNIFVLFTARNATTTKKALAVISRGSGALVATHDTPRDSPYSITQASEDGAIFLVSDGVCFERIENDGARGSQQCMFNPSVAGPGGFGFWQKKGFGMIDYDVTPRLYLFDELGRSTNGAQGIGLVSPSLDVDSSFVEALTDGRGRLLLLHQPRATEDTWSVLTRHWL